MQGEHIGLHEEPIHNEKDYFIYADTDSLHTFIHPHIDYLLEIDPVDLGKWKHESSPEKARFLRAKTYIEVIPYESKGKYCLYRPFKKYAFHQNSITYISNIDINNNIPFSITRTKNDVKCAGMSDAVKEHVTFENFHYDFEDTEHKLGRKTVQGGVVLAPTPFQIKSPVKHTKSSKK